MTYFPDGSVFEGGFVDGKSVGKGRLVSKNGDYYEGSVLENVASGLGVSENNVMRYEGEFQNNLPHGQGTEILFDGRSRFVGTFFEGNKVAGVMTWGENAEYVYEGRFANNTFNGRGVMRSPEGVYYGDFVDGHKHGVGEMHNLEGAVMYRGNWANSMHDAFIQSQGNWASQ